MEDKTMKDKTVVRITVGASARVDYMDECSAIVISDGGIEVWVEMNVAQILLARQAVSRIGAHPLRDSGLPKTVRTALWAIGVRTLEDVAAMPVDEMLAHGSGIRTRTFRKIMAALNEAGVVHCEPEKARAVIDGPE